MTACYLTLDLVGIDAKRVTDDGPDVVPLRIGVGEVLELYHRRPRIAMTLFGAGSTMALILCAHASNASRFSSAYV